MKYKINHKSNSNTEFVYHSQDTLDINSIENNLDKIIFEKMGLILNQQNKIENSNKSPKFFQPEK